MTKTPMCPEFQFDRQPMTLPQGAWAKTGRSTLKYGDRVVFGVTQGEFRSYLFPVYTPSGFAITAESPVDHPHHNSIWIGSDQVRCRMPTGKDQDEGYTYNFYVNETFQGRSPGNILATASTGETLGSGRYRLNQTLEWLGPSEWGTAEPRVILHEQRTMDFTAGRTYHFIDICSHLRPLDRDVELGPTRHAFFNVRVAESMQVTSGGKFLDADGRTEAGAIADSKTRWVDLSGPVGGEHQAGITVIPHPACGQPWWFVSDWGVITVGHYRHGRKRILKGQSAGFQFRVVVHDGAAEYSEIARLHDDYVSGASQ